MLVSWEKWPNRKTKNTTKMHQKKKDFLETYEDPTKSVNYNKNFDEKYDRNYSYKQNKNSSFIIVCR